MCEGGSGQKPAHPPLAEPRTSAKLKPPTKAMPRNVSSPIAPEQRSCMVTSHTWQGGEGKCQRTNSPRPSPSSASHPAHLKPSQVEGISHLPVSVTALLSHDGDSGGGTSCGEKKECLCARGLLLHPNPLDTFSRAGQGIPAQSAQEAKLLCTFPHQARGARKLWERWGAGSSWALSAPSAPVLPQPHSSALPAAGPAGNSSLPRGLAAAQQAPPEPQPHSLTPGPRERRKSIRAKSKDTQAGPPPRLAEVKLSLFFTSSPWHGARHRPCGPAPGSGGLHPGNASALEPRLAPAPPAPGLAPRQTAQAALGEQCGHQGD